MSAGGFCCNAVKKCSVNCLKRDSFLLYFDYYNILQDMLYCNPHVKICILKPVLLDMGPANKTLNNI